MTREGWGESFAVDSARVRAVILKLLVARRDLRMRPPRLPVAFEGVNGKGIVCGGTVRRERPYSDEGDVFDRAGGGHYGRLLCKMAYVLSVVWFSIVDIEGSENSRY